MKKIFIILALFISQFSFAQSKAMQNLAEEYPNAISFVLYHSSLNMLNQGDDPEIAALAATIDKIKVLTIQDFSEIAQKQLITELESSNFEMLMALKHKSLDVLVYIMEEDETIEGYFLIVKSDENTMAIDVVGSPDAKQIGKIIDTVKNY